jgi:hypothetical protein
MKNLLPKKVEIYKNYATSIFSKFRRSRYGLGKAIPDDYVLMAEIKKAIVDWQANDDAGALSEENIQYKTWLPTGMYDSELLFDNEALGYQYSNPRSPDNLGVFYEYSNGSQNIIQVNANGAVTRINLNPSITINQNSSFIFTQETPSLMWIITHNMGRVPAVFVEDNLGNDISGVIEIIDSNSLRILFSSALAGKAYLS